MLTLVFVFGFLDYAWAWRPTNTPEQYRGQVVHLDRCMSGPLLFPCCGGCLGRFDFDGDGHVDLRDVAELQKRM